MDLVVFQYELASLDKEHVIPNMSEKPRKSLSITEWCRCANKYTTLYFGRSCISLP